LAQSDGVTEVASNSELITRAPPCRSATVAKGRREFLRVS